MNYALIIAGGSGNRMGQDIPKQFMHVDNCPIIIHTMMAFQKHPDIQGIAVVCLAGWETVLQSYANQFCITKLKWIFPGGSNGQESIHNGIYGLKEVGCGDDDLVLVHDAVRPLLSQDIISSNIAILTIFTLIAGNLQSSGFTQALVNIRKPTDNDYNSVFWFNVLVSLTMYVVLFFCAPLIADFFHQPCLTSLSRFVFLSFFISSFGIAQNGYMMKNMMNKEITIVNFMALISSNVVGLVLAFNGMAYWSLAWQQVIFILVLNIGRYYYTGWRPNFHIDFGPVRKMFGFSVKLLVTNIINTVSNNVLTFVFGRFYPINDVGNYSQAYNWDTKANSFVANTVGQIAQPVLASIQDDKNRELLVFRKMLRFTAFLSFPLMFGLTLVSREFILITIHEKWIASVPLLQILCVSGAFMPIYTLYQNLAISKGRSDVYMWCNLGQVVGLLALVLFCHQYGIQTMVIAYTVFIIAWLLVWQWMMKRVAGLRFLDVAKDILPFMLCAAATMVVTYFMTRSLQNIYLLLLVRLLVSATIYFCIMKLLKVQILEECIAFCKRGR